MLEILNGTKEVIRKALPILAKDYKEKTGRNVCLTCPSDIQYMILSLKIHYQMTQFKFKKPVVQYKNRKGDKVTISNSNMTDESAIEFLKTNPDRIKLFLEYPSNYKELLEGKKETKKQKEKRLVIEAEIQVAKEAKELESKKAEPASENPGSEKEVDTSDLNAEEAAIAEAEKVSSEASENEVKDVKPTKESLRKLGLRGLRDNYPDVKATSIKLFVEKVLAL